MMQVASSFITSHVKRMTKKKLLKENPKELKYLMIVLQPQNLFPFLRQVALVLAEYILFLAKINHTDCNVRAYDEEARPSRKDEETWSL